MKKTFNITLFLSVVFGTLFLLFVLKGPSTNISDKERVLYENIEALGQDETDFLQKFNRYTSDYGEKMYVCGNKENTEMYFVIEHTYHCWEPDKNGTHKCIDDTEFIHLDRIDSAKNVICQYKSYYK